MSTTEEIEKRDPSETKPQIPESFIPEVVSRLYGMKVTKWKELNSYDDKNYHIHVEKTIDNTNINSVNELGYVLKILNSGDSKDPAIIEGQHKLLLHLQGKSLPVQIPIKTIGGKTWTTESFVDPNKPNKQFGPYIVHMLTYVDGVMFVDVPFYPPSLYNIGVFAGRVHKAFEGFENDYIEHKSDDFIWSLTNMAGLKEYTFAVTDQDNLTLANAVIDAFNTEVVSNYDKFTKGYIHADMNEQNILVSETNNKTHSHDVTAFIDYMDAQFSYRVFDVAILIAYLSIESTYTDTLDVGGHVLAGYMSELDLNQWEIEALRVCVCSRIIQSLVMGAYSYLKTPTNTYLLQTSKRGWMVVRKIWNVEQSELKEKWTKIVNNYRV